MGRGSCTCWEEYGPAGHGDGKLERDTIVKEFVQAVDDMRRQVCGQPALCGKAQHNDGLTLESALRWEQELYEELRTEAQSGNQ